MSLFGKLSATPERIKNVDLLINELIKAGFTNPYLQAAILGVIAKESGFVPKNEVGYQNTSADRIKTIFKSHFGGWRDSEVDRIKRIQYHSLIKSTVVDMETQPMKDINTVEEDLTSLRLRVITRPLPIGLASI